MYALLSCRCGDPEKAYPFFMKSAQADWIGGGMICSLYERQ